MVNISPIKWWFGGCFTHIIEGYAHFSYTIMCSRTLDHIHPYPIPTTWRSSLLNKRVAQIIDGRPMTVFGSLKQFLCVVFTCYWHVPIFRHPYTSIYTCCLFVYLFIHWFIRSFIHSSFLSFIHSCIYLCSHLLCRYLFMRIYILCINKCVYIYMYMYILWAYFCVTPCVS